MSARLDPMALADLYDALEGARRWVVSFPVVNDTARQAMLKQIDSALARARGES